MEEGQFEAGVGAVLGEVGGAVVVVEVADEKTGLAEVVEHGEYLGAAGWQLVQLNGDDVKPRDNVADYPWGQYRVFVGLDVEFEYAVVVLAPVRGRGVGGEAADVYVGIGVCCAYVFWDKMHAGAGAGKQEEA